MLYEAVVPETGVTQVWTRPLFDDGTGAAATILEEFSPSDVPGAFASFFADNTQPKPPPSEYLINACPQRPTSLPHHLPCVRVCVRALVKRDDPQIPHR